MLPAAQRVKYSGDFVPNKIKEHSIQNSEISEYGFQELPMEHSSQYGITSGADHSYAQSSVKNAFFTSHSQYPTPVTTDHRFQPLSSHQSPPFQPRLSSPRPAVSANESNPPDTSDLAKYLVRRELVSSGLLTFDDKSENYWAWKASFLNAIVGLYLSPREELDLKWLGPKSSEEAKRLRAVHTYDATAGVKMVWQRLEDSYGSPEATENALLKRLEDFPKIANRENHKLRELGDLISELDAARVDGLLPGLSYLDTSQGITPIVQKLPFHLQDKWITSASYYKEQHHASYPPFPVFVKFVCDKAKTLNDPSFAPLLSTGCPSVYRPERLNKPNFKTAVSVRKTEVTAPTGYRVSSDQKMVEPDKLCPNHNKPHSQVSWFQIKDLG